MTLIKGYFYYYPPIPTLRVPTSAAGYNIFMKMLFVCLTLRNVATAVYNDVDCYIVFLIFSTVVQQTDCTEKCSRLIAQKMHAFSLDDSLLQGAPLL